MDEQTCVKNPCILYRWEESGPVLGVPRHAEIQNEITFDWLHTLTKVLTKLDPRPSASNVRLLQFVRSLAAIHQAQQCMHQSSAMIYLQIGE
jgi:hypothetical protein